MHCCSKLCYNLSFWTQSKEQKKSSPWCKWIPFGQTKEEPYRRELTLSSSKWYRSNNCHIIILAQGQISAILTVTSALSCIARFVLTLQVIIIILFPTGMNVNHFIFVWNILIGFELSTASRGSKGGKVKMVKIHLLFWDAMWLFFNDSGLS